MSKRICISNINPNSYYSEIEKLVSSYLPNHSKLLFIKPNNTSAFALVEVENRPEDEELHHKEWQAIDGMLFGAFQLKLKELDTKEEPKKVKPKKKRKNKKPKLKKTKANAD